MPVHWRTNFVNSGQNVHQVSLEALRTYMVQQEAQTDAHHKKTRDINKKSQMKTPFYCQNRNNKFSKKYQGSTHESNNDKEERKNRKISNDDDCPIHGSSHKWGQCHQNQYGENFCPRRNNNNNSNTHSNFSQNRSQRSSFYQQGPPSQV